MTRLSLILLTVILSGSAWAETTLTYQGRLANAGQAANGLHDFVFRLFDDEISGSQSGTDVAVAGVDVTGGVFTVELDFGDAPFNSSPRWLEIDVREAGTGMYTTLSPRQRVGATPFAIETLFVAPGAVDTAALQDNSVTTNKIADGNVFTDDLANFAVSTDKLSNQAVTQLKLAAGAVNNLQLQDNAVSSSKIADGTITGADINGGLYTRKNHIYAATSTVTVNFATERLSVECADANDILVEHVCNVPSNTSDLTILSERLVNVHGADLFPATLTCTAQNRVPKNGEILTATVWCVAVD